MIRLANVSLCLALSACVGTDDPPGVAQSDLRRGVPAFLFCTAEGDSPLAATLVGQDLDALSPYAGAAQAAGVVVDIAEIGPDGSASLILIETTDILTVLHRDRVIDSISCIPADLCTGSRRAESGLCRG